MIRVVIADLRAACSTLANNRAITIRWLAAGLGGTAIHILLWQVSEPPDIFSDFYKAYWPAAEYLSDNGLSATWPLTEKGGFSNLPIFGWLFVPLVPLGEEPAAWTYLAIGLAALLGAWALLTRLAALKAPFAAILLFLFLVNGPVLNSLREGQSTHFILLLLVAALLLWRAKLEYAAGVVLGVCAVIKLPLLLFGAYFLLRRRWRIVAGGAMSMTAVGLLSLSLFGVAGHLGWYAEWVAPFLHTAIPAFNVQSIDGFLIRLAAEVTDLRDWEPREPSLAHRIARLCAFAVMFGGSYWVVWRAAGSGPRVPGSSGASARDLLEFVLVLTLALITSPVSWTHYYLLMLLPWGLYLGGQLALPDDAATRWLMRIGYSLAALPVIMPAEVEPNWPTAILARTVVSAWLFGGLLMFTALARGAWRGDIKVVEGLRGEQR